MTPADAGGARRELCLLRRSAFEIRSDAGRPAAEGRRSGVELHLPLLDGVAQFHERLQVLAAYNR